MRFTTLEAALGAASLFLSAQPAVAKHSHHHHAHELFAAKRHGHGHLQAGDAVNTSKVQKRSGCSLPDHPDLVFVPGAENNGFAMSPDEPCTDGKYCPFACKPGKVMAQWEPGSTYKYPESMNGGLYCNNGKAEKPFPKKPYCVDGTGTVEVVNKCGKVVSFCQTVLPGNEAMIIPTDVTSHVKIAVPGASYWASTAAHYYVNAPGVSSSEGCIWGDPSRPIGNWSPYVAGANTVSNGDTYVKLAWNPIYIGCDLAKEKPNFGLKVECPGGGCNGLPCAINPAEHDVGGLESPVKATGVGGANFCVVTVPKGKSANIVVFNTDGSGGSDKPDKEEKPTTKAAPPPPKPTPKKEPPKTTIKEEPVSSAPPSSTLSPSEVTSVWAWSAPSSSAQSTSKEADNARIFGGIFHENSTHSESEEHSSHVTTSMPAESTTIDEAESVPTTSKNEGAADQGGAAIAGLVVALVAAAALY